MTSLTLYETCNLRVESEQHWSTSRQRWSKERKDWTYGSTERSRVHDTYRFEDAHIRPQMAAKRFPHLKQLHRPNDHLPIFPTSRCSEFPSPLTLSCEPADQSHSSKTFCCMLAHSMSPCGRWRMTEEVLSEWTAPASVPFRGRRKEYSIASATHLHSERLLPTEADKKLLRPSLSTAPHEPDYYRRLVPGL